MTRLALIATVLIGLVLPASASSASLAPQSVQTQVGIVGHTVGDRMVKADGVANTSFEGWGMLGICGKKRGQPYNCEIQASAMTLAWDDSSGWTSSTSHCTVWIQATRRYGWINPVGTTCPANWLP